MGQPLNQPPRQATVTVRVPGAHAGSGLGRILEQVGMLLWGLLLACLGQDFQIEGFGNRANVVCQRRNPVDMGVGVYPTLALQLPCP